MVEYPDVQCSPAVGSSCTELSAAQAPSAPGGAPVLFLPGRSKEGARTVNAWREQWRQLGLQAWSAESDSRRETQNPRSLSQEHLEELRAELRKGDADLRGWEAELWGGMAKVRKRIKVLARNVHFAPQQGDIRRMVQAAEHDLRIFAEQTRHEEDELAALECSLQDTLESSLVRFEGWCAQESALRKPPESVSKPARPPSCSRVRQADAGSKKEAKQLDSMHEQLDKLAADMVADGGETGGWSCDDHDTFLRVFRKYKRKTGVEFIAEAQQLLSHKEHEDLVGHISWMLVYEDRQLQKRQLVEKWRCMRAATATKEAPADAKQALTAAAAREEKRQRACSRERVTKELSEKKKQVEEWRIARSEEQQAQQAEQGRRTEEAKQREVQERQRQAETRRQAMEGLRERRAADDALLGKGVRNATPTAAAMGQPMSLEDKRRIAERNAALLQKRAAQVQAKRTEPEASVYSQCFEPPRRASSAGALRHVESRYEESTRLHVDRSRDLREDQSTTCQSSSSKYNVVPGNFAHQGVVRTMRKSASWRPHFGA